MGVVIIKSTEHNFFFIVAIISIGIFEQDEVCTLGYINTVVRNFETDGNVEVICEIGLFVCFPIVVSIFKNDELILRFGISNSVVGVARHGGHPEPSFVIK